MTAHDPLTDAAAAPENGGPVAQLSAIIRLVDELAGTPAEQRSAIDDRAIAAAYRRAPGIARRRFERLSREAAQIATAGVEALVEDGGSQKAAADLAAVLRRAMRRLSDITG